VIVVARDTEGLRIVLEQMLEREHDLLRLAPKLEGKTEAQKEFFLAQATKVTLSPGYERWAAHLMWLEQLHNVGVPYGQLLAVEVSGLSVLHQARNVHRGKHPNCGACGMPQDNRFQMECMDCGTKFRRRSR
jgi:hypothetical protein